MEHAFQSPSIRLTTAPTSFRRQGAAVLSPAQWGPLQHDGALGALGGSLVFRPGFAFFFIYKEGSTVL